MSRPHLSVSGSSRFAELWFFYLKDESISVNTRTFEFLESLVHRQSDLRVCTFIHEVSSFLLLVELFVIEKHIHQFAMVPAENSSLEVHDAGDLLELPF